MKPGELVRLKSGGPDMVVEKSRTDADGAVLLSVSWFSRVTTGDSGFNPDAWDKPQSAWFDSRCLEAIERE